MLAATLNSTMNEIWIQSLDYPKYEISNLGQVRVIKTGRILKQSISTKGHLTVWVSNPWRSNMKSVARLVMHTFSRELIRYRQVIRFKDGNLLNCSFENLEFESVSAKVKRQWENGRYSRRNVTNTFPKGALNPNSRESRLKRGLYVSDMSR